MTIKYLLPFLLFLSACSNVELDKTSSKKTEVRPEQKTAKVEPVQKAKVPLSAMPLITPIDVMSKDTVIDKKAAKKKRALLRKELAKPNPKRTKKMIKFCKKVDRKFRKYGWGKSYCEHFNWHHVRNSVLGDPLMWVSYGDEKAHKKNHKDATLIMCGVHGDEITPIKFCYDVLFYLEKVRLGLEPGAEQLKDKMVIVAPIVNPDSFFKRRPTRTNARGIDINRNFPTKDWKRDAIRLWKTRYRAQKRRNPGKYAMSEPEVLFQVNLIKRYKFDKIVSVHSPLTLIDYDGPEHNSAQAQGANDLLITMSKKASGYKIKNYPFFPGSLGNWAGNERKIPTYTLELPTSDNRNHKKYWKTFRPAILSAISHDMREEINVAAKEEKDSDESKSVN